MILDISTWIPFLILKGIFYFGFREYTEDTRVATTISTYCVIILVIYYVHIHMLRNRKEDG